MAVIPTATPMKLPIATGPVLIVVVTANCPQCVGIKEPDNFARFEVELLKQFPDMSAKQIVISAPRAPINVDLYPAGLNSYTISGWTPAFMLFNRQQWTNACTRLGRDNKAPLDRMLVMNGVNKNGTLEQIPAKYNFKSQSDIFRWIRDNRNDPILTAVTPSAPGGRTPTTSGLAKGAPRVTLTSASIAPQPCFGRVAGRPAPRQPSQR